MSKITAEKFVANNATDELFTMSPSEWIDLMQAYTQEKDKEVERLKEEIKRLKQTNNPK